MSASMILTLTAAYAVPLALISLLLISEKHRTRRLLTVVLLALPLFYIGHYLLLAEIQGWPSNTALPDQFRLISFHITEPDSKKDEGGQILLWVENTDDQPPRVHRLAYHKDLHRELISAGKRQQQGKPQIGSRIGARLPGSAGATGQAGKSISFRDATSRSLPAKASQ